MASILDVAEYAGVSASTARRALHEPQRVAPKTLKRVLAAVAALEYEPNQAAGALRRGRTRAVGLLVGDIMAHFFAALTRSIGRAVRAEGYSLLMAENEYREDLELDNLRLFHSHRVSGLILRSAYGTSHYDYLKRMRLSGTVIVEIDYYHRDSPFHHVMLDNRGAVEKGLAYLRRLGHVRIAGIGLPESLHCSDERTQSFLEMARACGFPSEYVLTRAAEGATNVGHAYYATLQLMRLTEPPTALFALTGEGAAGTLQALQELNLRVPQDVSLLTFDNDLWKGLVTPPIDVLEQPISDMGRAAVRIILDQLERPTQAVVRQRFPARLCIRGSCVPPKA